MQVEDLEVLVRRVRERLQVADDPRRARGARFDHAGQRQNLRNAACTSGCVPAEVASGASSAGRSTNCSSRLTVVRQRADAVVHGVDRIVDFVRQPGDELSQRAHLFGLHQLLLQLAQVVVGLAQLAIAAVQVLVQTAQLDQRADAGLQLSFLERLGQVIVGPAVQPADLHRQVGLGREHDERDVSRIGVVLDAAAELLAVDARHHHVGNDQVGVFALGHVEPFLAVAARRARDTRRAAFRPAIPASPAYRRRPGSCGEMRSVRRPLVPSSGSVERVQFGKRHAQLRHVLSVSRRSVAGNCPQWQIEPEPRAATQLAFDVDLAAVQFDQALHQRQAKARAAELPRTGTINLHETVEDPAALRLRRCRCPNRQSTPRRGRRRRCVSTRMLPPPGVNFMALESRLLTTVSTLCSSAPNAGNRESQSTTSSIPRCWASGRGRLRQPVDELIQIEALDGQSSSGRPRVWRNPAAG